MSREIKRTYLEGVDRNAPFYVYGIWNETTDTPIYIGKGGYARRPLDHFSEIKIRAGRNKHKLNTIAKAARDGHTLGIRVLFSSSSEEIVLAMEVYWIAIYGRAALGSGPLTNLTDGGDGISGARHNPVSKARISEALKQRSPEIRAAAASKMRGRKYALGYKHTAQAKATISAKNRGRKLVPRFGESNPFYGKTHTAEVKEIRRALMIGNKFWVGRRHSEESKAKISANAASRRAEVKAKMSAARKGKPWSEARRAAQINKSNKP